MVGFFDQWVMSAVSLRHLLWCSVLGGLALPPVALAAERPVVAVFTLKSDGARIKARELDRLSDYIGAALTESGRYQVVPKSELKTALNAKKKASYKQCYAESCQIEIGKELAADKVLAGVVARIGSRCTITLKIVDLRKATEEAAARAKGKCGIDNVLESLDKALAKLTGGRVSSGGGGPSSPVTAPVVQGEDYGDLDAEIAAETRKITAERVAKRARERAATKDWAKIRPYVGNEKLSVKRRVQILEKFLSRFLNDNPHLADAQTALQKLQTSGGMVRVPGGNFYMGCNEKVDSECDSDEKPGKTVHVAGFRIDVTEVTVAAYRKCVDAGACLSRGLVMPYFSGKEQPEWAWACNWNKSGRTEHPVNCLDRSRATTYCKWAGKRLPSEKEWEKAARGTDGRKYAWGNTGYGSTKVANIADETAKRKFSKLPTAEGYDDGYVGTAPVGTFPAGNSPYGAQDMIGNVFEWVAELPTEGRYRPLRGGSWGNDPTYARASDRDDDDPARRGSNIGFRCAQSE